MIEFLAWDLLMKIPLITFIRTLTYLILAVFGGAGQLYDRFLGPFLTKNEQKIDDGIEWTKGKVSYVFGTAASAISSFVLKQVNDFIFRSVTAPLQPKSENPPAAPQQLKKEDPAAVSK